MNGPQDMGGRHGFGPVIPEADEPIFHADWEKKALSITVAMGFTGSWNIDISRHARETIAPAQYLSSTYYEIWLAGLERLMLDRELVTVEELKTGQLVEPAKAVKRTLMVDEVDAALAAGGPVDRPVETKPLFSPGDHVRTLNIQTTNHTRLPSYARRAIGEVHAVQGCHVFPDTNAHGEGENPKWLYSVRFDARELFGENAEAGNEVMIDCWEPYLERA